MARETTDQRDLIASCPCGLAYSVPADFRVFRTVCSGCHAETVVMRPDVDTEVVELRKRSALLTELERAIGGYLNNPMRVLLLNIIERHQPSGMDEAGFYK